MPARGGRGKREVQEGFTEKEMTGPSFAGVAGKVAGVHQKQLGRRGEW